MAEQMKGITICGDCGFYNWKKHRCSRGCTAEGTAQSHFYEDCPLPDVREVVRGKWMDDNGKTVPWDKLNKNCPAHSAFCSVCGEWLTASDEYPAIGNFCPNCGADMRGANDD